MRPIAASEASFNLSLLHSPPPHSSCGPHNACGHSPSNQLEANAAMVLIVLLCALICALALNAAIRCSLGSSSLQSSDQINTHQGKPTTETGVPPSMEAETVVYVVGMKAIEECAICLTEFVEGEKIEVLKRCKHGFHEQCIQNWLFSHYSCPTCRTSCLVSSSSQEDEACQVPSSSV